MANFDFKKITLPNGDVGTVTDVAAQNSAAEAIDLANTAKTSADSANQAASSANTKATNAQNRANSAYNLANGKTTNNISMNGSSNNNPTFYAPTSAGTNGYFLKSNGAGAPTWTAMSSGPDIVVNSSQPTGQKSGDFWYQIV